MLKFFRAFLHQLVTKGSLAIVVTVVAVILAISIRGIWGNPSEANLNDPKWKDEGPLELSPDRGRFALTFSLVENHSYTFSLPITQFAMPDVAEDHGKFVSLFAPTVSFIVIPGYVIGKMYGLSQVGSFGMIALFAFINFLLIRAIAIRLGAHPLAATIAGLLFVFASPAYAYAVTLYQHHISTFLILASIYTLLRWKTPWSLAIIWFLCALSISVDNPNVVLMFPIGLFALGRAIQVEDRIKNFQLNIKVVGLITMIVMVIPIGFFLYFNKMSYGNPFQLAGTVANAKNLQQLTNQDIADVIAQQTASASATTANGGTQPEDHKSALGFFKTRNLPHGLYEHFLSLDRGMIVYTPIMLLGFIGFIYLFTIRPDYARLFLAIIALDAVLYSMWGDPYGGWAFGSRYMIPAYALLAILLAILLTKFRKNIPVLLLIFGVSVYSLGVNTIGAVTSNRNPPQVEVLGLEAITHQQQRYTFLRNEEMLNDNRSKSFVFAETPVHTYLTAWQFVYLISGTLSGLVFLLLVALVLNRKHLS